MTHGTEVSPSDGKSAQKVYGISPHHKYTTHPGQNRVIGQSTVPGTGTCEHEPGSENKKPKQVQVLVPVPGQPSVN